jgi:hypothetical protein
MGRKKVRTIKEIIESKRWKEYCPRCMSAMDYIECGYVQKQWAPCDYVWACQNCPSKVFFLDGNINAKKNSGWHRRQKTMERKALFAAVFALGFKKKRPPDKPGGLQRTDSAEVSRGGAGEDPPQPEYSK